MLVYDTDWFINKARTVHGDEYDYSRVVYKNSRSPVIIICRIHGSFQQTAKRHLIGQKCPKCQRINIIAKATGDTTSFITKAKSVHGDRYDYSEVEYTKIQNKIKIICHIHGEFYQTPNVHLRGSGCPKCGLKREPLVDLSEFLRRARLAHGDKYDYSMVAFKRVKDKVTIICKKHGAFKQSVRIHLAGHGCNQCAHNFMTPQRFLDAAKSLYGEYYKYELPDKITTQSKITIICPKHGKFRQLISGHLAGHGCWKCAIVRNGLQSRITLDKFASKARKIHGDQYAYTGLEWDNGVKVIANCQKHGQFTQFTQFVHNHYKGNGCPACAVDRATEHQSLGQKQVYDFIRSFVDGTISENDREAIAPHEIDIFVPEVMVGVEFHGSYYHSYNMPESRIQRYKHHVKADLAHSAGIELLQIFEHEWFNKRNIIESILRSKFGINNRLYARCCEVREVDDIDAFCDQYHIQGHRPAKICLGLFHNGTMVMGASWSECHNHAQWELIRLCTMSGYTVVGGVSKLCRHFSRLYNGSVMAYANRRFSSANSYKKVGFGIIGTTKPGYCYYKSMRTYSRHKYQKHKLQKILDNYNSNLSESENMFRNGYRRIWDAGHYILRMES